MPLRARDPESPCFVSDNPLKSTSLETCWKFKFLRMSVGLLACPLHEGTDLQRLWGWSSETSLIRLQIRKANSKL